MDNIYIITNSQKKALKHSKKYFENGYKIVGIEAEWGDTDLAEIFEHTDISLSHHGKFSQNSPPCTRWDLYGKYKNDTCFIFSHIDLDSVFGCWILEGSIPDTEDIRELTYYIGWIDTHGQHRAHEDIENYKRWSPLLVTLNLELSSMKHKYNKIDIILTEFRKFFLNAINNLDQIKLIENYQKFEESAYNSLDKMFSIRNKLHVFIGYTNFVSKYYIEYKDYISISDINIHYDPRFGRVTLGVKNEEFAKKLFGENGVVAILKKYFGPESGGHITVGGSPKNKKVSFTNFIKLVKEIKGKVKDAEETPIS